MGEVGVVLGFFDGVHQGHRAVISKAFCCSKVILLTFKDSPALYFGKDVEYIFSREKNYDLIRSLGVDEIIEQDFSSLANLSAENYLRENVIDKYSPTIISTGFNYTFGANRYGNSKFLENKQKEFVYKYLCTPPYIINNEVVSSTSIRSFLKSGDIEKANEFLGSNFSIKSVVIEGQKLGRELGFPTANMKYPSKIVKIPYGVYAVRVLDKPAVLNWGIKPTINSNSEILELHIPNFSGELYGLSLEVEFIKKIRDEKKFESLDCLKTQIKKDVEICLKL